MKCAFCQSPIIHLYEKYSPVLENNFQIYRCINCRLWQIYPIPEKSILDALYEDTYFSQRTERGYNNYNSTKVRDSIISTIGKNLSDLKFHKIESSIPGTRRCLEIGSASGIFLEVLKGRGWNARGIDISESMVNAGKEKGIDIVHGEFLEYDFYKDKFDLIVLWATLEHLTNPDRYLHKISSLLEPGGSLILSTANTGFWARIYGVNWRYLNVPEHIFYFNRKNLNLLLESNGLQIQHSFTYGSGFTTPDRMSPWFRVKKKVADALARKFHSGDMIVVHARKTRRD